MDGTRNSFSKMALTIRNVGAPFTFLMLISFFLCSIMNSTKQIYGIERRKILNNLRLLIEQELLEYVFLDSEEEATPSQDGL
jgi:hypothetical protein